MTTVSGVRLVTKNGPGPNDVGDGEGSTDYVEAFAYAVPPGHERRDQ